MNPDRSQRRDVLRAYALAVLGALILAVYFFVPVSTVLDASLDASNYASYTRFAAQHRQFGTEVVPMAGPYGFVVYGWVYNGDLYGRRLVFEFATKFVFGLFVVWFFRRTKHSVTGWIWLGTNLLVLPTTTELTYDLPVLYAALFLLFARPGRVLALLTVAFLAFLALCKGTQLIFTLAVLAVVAAEAAWRRAWSDLLVLVGGFLASLVALWCAAGQDLAHLPAYMRNIQELSTGYVSGMALQETTRTSVVGLASVAVALAGITWLVFPNRREPSIVAATIVLLGFTFLEWKHGFVRADGHVFLFFHYCIIGGATVFAFDSLTEKPMRAFRPCAALFVIGAVLALYGSGEGIAVRFAEYGHTLIRNIPAALEQLARPFARKQQLEAALAENRVRFALPETVERIGRSSIGFFGYQSGYLALNGLNERPSPVAGGGPFSVFTPHLQQINEQYLLSSATRPDYYLLKLQTIDERFIPQDDAPSLNALLTLYRPVMAERGMLLLRAAAADRPADVRPARRTLNRARLNLGEPVPIPAVRDDEMLLVSFDLPLSAKGVIRAALYKAPLVSLTLAFEGSSSPVTHRIIPSMASAPFILSPVLAQTEDLLALYTAGDGRRPQTLQVTSAPESGLSANACFVTFYAQSRPAPLEPDLKKQIAGQFAYPVANVAPALVEASNARVKEIDGRTVQLVEPPGRIVFPLQGDERELRFDYGFDPEAYIRGTTDGADFVVELLPPNGQPEQLYLSRREPKTVVADRGRHHVQLWLPLIAPGSQLQLRTGGGARGAADWDWTYYDNIQLNRGPLRIEQFPGFTVAPTSVEGAAPRMIQHEGKDALLLNVPGKITLTLSGNERTLHFLGGLLPGAYLEGNTDGAEFIVELKQPNEPAQTLAKRWLQPKSVPADRGTQRLDIELPAHVALSQLTISLAPGPHNDASWDWTYLAEVRLTASP